MLKWCQVRVFVATCAGMLLGNLVAGALHVAAAFVVIPCGLAGWLAGNGMNALIAARASSPCDPIVGAGWND